jgi:thiamine biosynthesis lipoprotein
VTIGLELPGGGPSASGDDPSVAAADALLGGAFKVIERVQALMSFHSGGSDLARLNAAAAGEVIRVDPETFAVLQLAATVSRASAGVFDVTMAPALVAAGRLPAPPGAPPDPVARWSDLELEPPDGVRLRRRLWVDLGGIAKGHAVDLAAAFLQRAGVAAFRINAGGDLRVGAQLERVTLDVPGLAAPLRPGTARPGVAYPAMARPDVSHPAIELQEGSLASSAVDPVPGVHLDGRDHRAPPAGRFVSVVAPRCAVADALTKVVLAQGAVAAPILAGFGATAYLYAPGAGWQVSGGGR